MGYFSAPLVAVLRAARLLSSSSSRSKQLMMNVSSGRPGQARFVSARPVINLLACRPIQPIRCATQQPNPTTTRSLNPSWSPSCSSFPSPQAKRLLPPLQAPFTVRRRLRAVEPTRHAPRAMAKKRKRTDAPAEAAGAEKPDDSAPERPPRTLFGFKDPAPDAEPASAAAAAPFRNKEKVLITCSRRITYRYRHLMQDILSLLPHAKKDSKVESKQSKGNALNELLELRSCSSCLFFECRKQKDLYLWMVKSPGGPSVKFLVNAVHTMEELKLTGNHLKGSRPLLTFSTNFDEQPHWMLVKEMITQIFATPKDHRKAKPFHDHVFAFSIIDGHVWFRNYQISVPHNEIDKVDKGGLDKMTLIEVGPRFCLNPIKIFGGSFGGPTWYENPYYISPNQIRALEKRQKAGKYVKKVKAKVRRKMHEMENTLEPDEFAELWKGE